jgi:hypothetical protein
VAAIFSCVNHQAPGDGLFRDAGGEPADPPQHPMDGDAMRALHRRLLTWLNTERQLQAANRLDMAIDADMYDNRQWMPEDAEEVRSRNQAPLVYNEVAPMVDWLIGTERRTRIDSSVLPRTEDDVALADVKTKVMKYMADVNRAEYVRSTAFAEAVKCGLSWIDDGIRDDASKEPVYKQHESWRNVLHDSRAIRAPDLSGCRYLLRWRDVDLDVALAMFPQRAALLERAASDYLTVAVHDAERAGWGGPMPQEGGESARLRYLGSSGMFEGVGDLHSRRIVRIYECQYRDPVTVQTLESGPLAGAALTPFDPVALQAAQQDQGAGIVDKTALRMHVAVFVEAGMLAASLAPWRHNDFSLTPVWCYRRSSDGMPYGVIRRVRDVQMDLNKRASKASFLYNTNQIIADEDATDDWENLREEAADPHGILIKKKGAELALRRDSEGAQAQLNMMQLDAAAIQKSAGVADENLGRQTNAVSGEAIKARQLQGSVVTTELFDNLRLSTRVSGQKELSLIEQFMTQERVIRLTGNRGQLQWARINRPQVLPDGSVRYLDDITASQADFVVSEQDYSGTLRQVMFEQLSKLAAGQPPALALRLMTMAFNYSDLPNHEAIAQEFRAITGEPDPNQPPTDGQQQAMAAQQAQQMQAVQMQAQQGQLALAETQAKVREINARAAELEAKTAAAQSQGQLAQGQAAAVQDAVMQVRLQASAQIERLQAQLAHTQGEMAAMRARADDRVQAARIAAAASVRVAELRLASTAQMDEIGRRIDEIAGRVDALTNVAPLAPEISPAPPADGAAVLDPLPPPKESA